MEAKKPSTFIDDDGNIAIVVGGDTVAAVTLEEAATLGRRLLEVATTVADRRVTAAAEYAEAVRKAAGLTAGVPDVHE